MLQHSRCRVPLIAVLSTRGLSTAPPSSSLFVGGLSYDTNETVLKDAFEEYGEILEVKVICNRWTGKSKGFALVKFALEAQATRALQQMNGQFLEGRNIRVHYFANKQQGTPEP